MSSEFVRCEFCEAEMLPEKCEMAAYHKTIDGKEYVFCCEKCAKRYEKKKK